jgi:undecaprenyl-diphosphatase
VSSTGHIKLFNAFWRACGAKNYFSNDFTKVYEYVIQFAAILAVVILFWTTIFPFGREKQENGKMKIVWKQDTFSLLLKVAVACIPAVIAILPDMLLEELCEKHALIEPLIISIALIVYGVIFIFLEKFNAKRNPKLTELSQLSYKTAFFIGCFQILAAIPGTSRSGITILGALLLSVDRTTASKFTFILAIPTMIGTSAYKILGFIVKGATITTPEIGYLLIGCAVAFAVSMLTVKLLMNFVRKHDFKPFGWYRIALGALVLGVMVIPALF